MKHEKGKRTPHHTAEQCRERVGGELPPDPGFVAVVSRILVEEMGVKPSLKAARRLSQLGVMSNDFWLFCQTAEGRGTPTDWTTNVMNDLRNLETAVRADE